MSEKPEFDLATSVPVPAPEDVAPLRRRRFSVAADADDIRRALRRKAVANIKIRTTSVKKARERFDRLLKGLQADDYMAASEAEEAEAPCLLVAGPSGAGKSHILRRLRENPSLVPFEDEVGPVRPLLAIKAPSPCTLKTLGRKLYLTLTGCRLPGGMKEHEIWTELMAQLDAQLVSVVMIDEFHHAFTRRTDDERRNLVETLKSLLIPDPSDPLRPPGAEFRPIMLVLSGMPWITKVIERDLQLNRRSVEVGIERLGKSSLDLKKAEKFLAILEEKLAFPQPSGLAEPDMVRRMLAASNGYFGRMVALAKEAAFIAIAMDKPCLDRKDHLAAAFGQIFRVKPARNPFLVTDISAFKPLPEREFERLTLLKGTGEAAPADTGEGEQDEEA